MPWVFQRRNGYFAGLEDAGIEADECMVLWLKHGDYTASSEEVERYLEKRQPTAVIFGSWVLVPSLAPLVKSGKLCIPRDLSVITFDQHPGVMNWLGVQPTTIAIPLGGMGRALARMSRDIAHGRPLEPITTLGCQLMQGESVKDLNETLSETK
ncbi:MAG TPA: substrate-binding domain-containing protein, partial [Tepidisphaeraceae bacterium]|jgi:DNA-binding LacI/PurR family transcriptional regulator